MEEDGASLDQIDGNSFPLPSTEDEGSLIQGLIEEGAALNPSQDDQPQDAVDRTSRKEVETAALEGASQTEAPVLPDERMGYATQTMFLRDISQDIQVKKLFENHPDSDVLKRVKAALTKSQGFRFEGEGFSITQDKKSKMVYFFGNKKEADAAWCNPEKYMPKEIADAVIKAKKRKQAFRVTAKQQKYIEKEVERRLGRFLENLRREIKKEIEERESKRRNGKTVLGYASPPESEENYEVKRSDSLVKKQPKTLLEELVSKRDRKEKVDAKKSEEKTLFKKRSLKKLAIKMQALYQERKEYLDQKYEIYREGKIDEQKKER